MDERRGSPRSRLSEDGIAATITVIDGSKRTGWAINVSEYGAMIAGDTHGLTVGSEVTIAFQYPYGQQQQLKCVVERLETGQSFAVRFLEPIRS